MAKVTTLVGKRQGRTVTAGWGGEPLEECGGWGGGVQDLLQLTEPNLQSGHCVASECALVKLAESE